MFDFSEGERYFLNEGFALALDDQGREVLVGLTYEESVALMLHSRDRRWGSREERAAMQALRQKHEMARIQGIGQSDAVRVQAIARAKAAEPPRADDEQ